MQIYKVIVLLLLISLANQSFAEQRVSNTQSYNSGVSQNTLVELYTSEGCSSCPPADRWLSSFKTHPKLWSGVIPIAFHVDYWDYIGWKDPFASSDHSERQRQYARENRENTVYTPGFKVNGAPWLSWRSDRLGGLELPRKKVGNLRLRIGENGEFRAEFDSPDPLPSAKLNIAVLGMDLVSQVQRGENRGKELRHDFVVLAHESFSNASATPKWQGLIPQSEVIANEYAVVAWVQSEGALSPIQAVAGAYRP